VGCNRLGAGILLLAVLTACGSASEPRFVAANPSPCASPYADGDMMVAIPEGSDAVRVQVATGNHLTVGWPHCGESGEFTSSDPEGALLSATDASSLGKGGPVVDVRYLAQKAGTVTIVGKGSKGSNGKLVVTITP
jgi:hypothetical protein